MSNRQTQPMPGDMDRDREVGRLRDEILMLQQRIADLDAMAHEDHLLGLPNRRGLMREIDRLISRCQRYDENCALLFLDFDGLKRVNDLHGHIAGDAALVHVAQLLVRTLRASDVLARFGGDEFCALLAHVDAKQAHHTAQRLERAVHDAVFTYEGKAVPLSVTIGITMVRENDTAEALLKRADEDMYRHKG